MNDIQRGWNDRRSMSNRLPHVFGSEVTCNLDTFPITIRRPKRFQSAFYNGKYGRHVVKVCCACERSVILCQFQIACDHRGRPIWFTGPHVGVRGDARLLREFPIPLDGDERALADRVRCSFAISADGNFFLLRRTLETRT